MAQSNFAFYLETGAEILKDADFGFATDPALDSGPWRKRWWKKIGRSEKYDCDILGPKDLTDPAAAVAGIFQYPSKWTFDCSEFVQVVNLYAWLNILKKSKFNTRVINSRRGIRIQPFIGSIFTARRHYYGRESSGAFMRYRPNGDQDKEQQSCMTAAEVFAAAPVGSRVNFKNDRGSGVWEFENTVKYSQDKVLAFPLDKDPLSVDDLILKFYQMTNPNGDVNEAKRNVWIKEIEFFVEVPMPVMCD